MPRRQSTRGSGAVGSVDSHRSHAGEALPSPRHRNTRPAILPSLTRPGACELGWRRSSALRASCDPRNSEQSTAGGRDRSELHPRICRGTKSTIIRQCISGFHRSFCVRLWAVNSSKVPRDTLLAVLRLCRYTKDVDSTHKPNARFCCYLANHLQSILQYCARRLCNMAEPPEVAAAKTEHPDCSFSTTRTDSFQLVNGEGRRSKQVDYYIQCPGERRQLIVSQRSEGGVDVAADSAGRDEPSDGFPGDELLRGIFGAARRPWGSEHASVRGGWPGAQRDPAAPIPWPFDSARRQLPPAIDDSKAGSVGAAVRGSSRPPSFPERHRPSFAEREHGSGVSI